MLNDKQDRLVGQPDPHDSEWHAVVGTFNTGSFFGVPYLYQLYNAYETQTTESCSTSTKGCCSGTTLTALVQDTSVLYNCFAPTELPNDFALQVRIPALPDGSLGILSP
jgi:hypothetical protein